MPNSLRIGVRVSESTGHDGVALISAKTRLVVDGRDIVIDAFEPGPAHEPERLLAPDGPLRAGREPRDVELAAADCTRDCCGALYVTIRRAGDQVVWNGWRNPDRLDPDLPEFRFDAERYDAEVARAEQDLSWEWPARTVARLLGGLLSAAPERIERWGFEVRAVSSWKPGAVDVLFFHPLRPVAEAPWLQFRRVLTVTDEDPAVQTARFAAELTERDPRDYAEICGGSAEYARRLGFEWPTSPR